MNVLVIKILAIGLTLSQLFTKPVEQFTTHFDPQTDQALVAQLLGAGCTYMSKQFGAEQIDFDFLFSTMLYNIKSVQSLTPAELDSDHLSRRSLSQILDIPAVYGAYKQFCKGEKSELSLLEVITFFNQTMENLPDPSKLKGLKLPESTMILDRNGERFTEIYTDNNRRKWVALKDMPEHLRQAFVAAEDKRFFEHQGLDVHGIIRAFANSVSSQSRPQGGSTITQQVIKNLLVGDDLTFERKMREMVDAVRLEKILTKDEILELYLNFVFLGRASWGVEMAAQSYFGKSVNQLSIAEGATLAALPRGPNYYSPDLHPERSKDRVAYVLDRMKENNYLTDGEVRQALNEKLEYIAFESPHTRAAFYFVDEIQRDAKRVAGIESLTENSYVVRSTIQPDLQKVVEESLEDGLVAYEAQSGRRGEYAVDGSITEAMNAPGANWQDVLAETHGKLWDVQWPLAVVIKVKPQVIVGFKDGQQATLVSSRPKLYLYDLVRVKRDLKARTATIQMIPKVQGAVVVLEAKTGRVLAMSGGFSYALSQLNRVTRSARQPGSSLKPFIYLSALNMGYQPNTLIADAPLSLPPLSRGGEWWSPKNYDGGTRGVVTIRTAVEQSLNLPTARLMSKIGRTPSEGLDYIRGITHELGIYPDPIRFYPFVLGAQPARVIDMATAYATIANIGLKPTPHFIDSIELNGKSVYERPRFSLQPVPSVDRVAFYQIRHILEGTVERGTAIKLKDLSEYVGGKTGTSNNQNDAWFIGFTNDLVVATWVGYDNHNERLSLGNKFTGARVALPIGERILRESFDIYKNKELLCGPPPEIKDQIVIYPIDVHSGQFNAGNYPEVFRADAQHTPKNTMVSLLSENEVNLQADDNPMSDENQEADAEESHYTDNEDTQGYYPGPESMADLWRRHPRQIDGFFNNPFSHE